MDQPLISVIVPAYNAERWIEKCCRSVFEQTYPNWELIVVDDGSTDGTGWLLQELESCEPRLRRITTENGGVCRARNLGLDASDGALITFLDADDMLTKDALEKMWQLMRRTDCQIAAMTKTEMDVAPASSGIPELWTGHQALEKALADHPASHSVYAKLYRRQVVEHLRFREGRKVHEDAFFVFQCFAGCSRVAYAQTPVYLYARTAGSASRGAFTDKYMDILYFAEEKARIIRESFPEYEYKIGDILIRANISLLYNLCKTYDRQYRPVQRECLSYIRRFQGKFQPETALEKRVCFLVKRRMFWLYKVYLYFRMRKVR